MNGWIGSVFDLLLGSRSVQWSKALSQIWEVMRSEPFLRTFGLLRGVWLRQLTGGVRLAIKVPDEGLLLFCEAARDMLQGDNQIRLYKNDYTPVAGSTLANFTEADFSGYSSLTLTGGSNAVMDGGRAKVGYSARVFTHDGGVTANQIYGYYVQNSGGDLLFAERDPDAPRTMAVLNDTIAVVVNFTSKSEF